MKALTGFMSSFKQRNLSYPNRQVLIDYLRLALCSAALQQGETDKLFLLVQCCPESGASQHGTTIGCSYLPCPIMYGFDV